MGIPPELFSELLMNSPWGALAFYFIRTITTRLDKVTNNMEKLTESVDELKDAVKIQNIRHDATEQKVDNLQVEVTILKEKVAT